MRPVFSALSILIALALTVSPMSDAVSAEPTGMLAKVTLCQNGASVEHWVDGQGQPVAPRHECLECCLSLVGELTRTPGSATRAQATEFRYGTADEAPIALRDVLRFQARGPPVRFL